MTAIANPIPTYQKIAKDARRLADLAERDGKDLDQEILLKCAAEYDAKALRAALLEAIALIEDHDLDGECAEKIARLRAVAEGA